MAPGEQTHVPGGPPRIHAAACAAPELDCLHHVLPADLLRAARQRAEQLGIGADQVLIRWGVINEAAYLERLAAFLALDIECLHAADRADTPLRDDQMRHAAESGVMPLRSNGDLRWTLAPRRLASRKLCELLDAFPSVRPRTRLASSEALHRFLQQQGGPALAASAAWGLRQSHPALSAGPVAAGRRPQSCLFRALGVLLLTLLIVFMTRVAGSEVLALLFLSSIGMRLAASLCPSPAPRLLLRQPERHLPIYTVIAALRGEAKSVASLVNAIEALDYPPEKLDVILVLEPDDWPTQSAVKRLGPRPYLRVLIAPAVGPQTKPKALNYALPFARGGVVVVFDAEDRPEPGQLRAALAAFSRGGPRVGCVQACLCIDNETNSWLSRIFTAEYAGQFDAVLPGMTRFELPLPLGGSSNHFRIDVLREVGAWDPHNVTEDADLGVRLARFGYRCATFASTTFEEAPITFGAWRRQRSRWMKGWMQTWCVHMRDPQRFWRDAGWRGVVTLNLVVGGNVLAALVHPLLLWAVASELIAGGSKISPDASTWLHGFTIAAGYVGAAAVAWIGLERRGRLREGWWLLLMPLYWGCLSYAAWRALYQFVWEPYRWEKTEHGVAKRLSPKRPSADSAVQRR